MLIVFSISAFSGWDLEAAAAFQPLPRSLCSAVLNVEQLPELEADIKGKFVCFSSSSVLCFSAVTVADFFEKNSAFLQVSVFDCTVWRSVVTEFFLSVCN